MHVLGLCGSFRQASVNRAVLRAAQELLPDGHTLSEHDYREVPLYDADLDTPASVEQLKAAIDQADAVVFFTPEYNHSVPGVLKNAIDWASRPAYRSVFVGKPCGIISAAGRTGGARAQVHLKTVLLGMAAQVYPGPEVNVVRGANEVEDGVYRSVPGRKAITKYLLGFVAWADESPT